MFAMHTYYIDGRVHHYTSKKNVIKNMDIEPFHFMANSWKCYMPYAYIPLDRNLHY